MSNESLELFTASAWGSLPQAMAWCGQTTHGADPQRSAAAGAPPPMEFVETLGFPRGTSASLLAEVLADIHATAPGARVERLLRPGLLSPLFSQSAAEASYALAILSIVESPGFARTLARLRSS